MGSPGGYVVGQVAESLGQRRAAPSPAPLARLFRAAAAPPVLVAAAPERKKRKCREEAEEGTEAQSSSVLQESPVKAKKARKKELSKAEKEVANRESALEQADEEEEQKLSENKAKQKKSVSQATIKKRVNNSSTMKQQKAKKVDDETVNRRTVFVGNLPVSCTAQALKSLFRQYGQIKSIRFRSLIPAEDTLSKKLAAIKHKLHPNAKFVNAYVVFKEECDAIKALKENGTEIASGFHIRVDIASKSSSHDNKRSIFLGNLSYDITDDAVREHFSVCGDVIAVRVVRDRKTGLGKGFGYVLFENTDAVHLALKLNESLLLGRKVRVKRCGEMRKAPRKTPSQSRAPKNRVNTALKNNDSFVGEKAVPSKKRTKSKGLKTIPRNKAGKNKQAFGKSKTRKRVR